MRTPDIAAAGRQFEALGTELVLRRQGGRGSGRRSYAIDVELERGRERFVIRHGEAPVELAVVNADRALRHLLLLVKAGTLSGVRKHLYLCGHDERHWFVAAVPTTTMAVTTVADAMEALKPQEVRAAQVRERVPPRKRRRRANAAFLRQGEWFFLPAPDLVTDPRFVLRRERLTRGGKPHVVDEAYRRGGETVYVCSRRPTGVPEAEYRRIMSRDPDARHWGWRVMRANPEVYVRGRVRHPDHATVVLQGWHRVLPNTEAQAPWRGQMAFLD